jgi:HK97 family phage major capsid protein
MGLRTIAERIADCKQQRGLAVDGMQTVLDVAEEESRTFTEDEADRFQAADEKVKALDLQIDRLEVLQEAQKKTAQPASDGTVFETPGSRIEVVSKLPPGLAFTRYALALMCSKGTLADAEHFAVQRWGDSSPHVAKAIRIAQSLGGSGALMRAAITPPSTTDPAFSPLVQYQTMASEFMELLRPATIIGQMQGFRTVPFNTRIQRQIASAVAGWVGEGKSKPVSKPGFDAVTIPFAKVAVIVAITDELARDASPSAELLVRNDMVNAISSFIDNQFIDPAVAGAAGVSPASVTFAGQKTPSSGITVSEVMADIATLLTQMAAQQISGPFYWVMNPRTQINLSMLRTAQDVFAFPEMSTGTFRGYPVIASSHVPISGVDQSTILVLMAPGDVLMADNGGIALDTSTEASLQMDSAPLTPPTPLVSLWQQNMLGIRAERQIYWLLRNAAAVQVLTGVAY